eukprot:scaffold4097_cov166-Amphora_coffeaeformis.AAC.38
MLPLSGRNIVGNLALVQGTPVFCGATVAQMRCVHLAAIVSSQVPTIALADDCVSVLWHGLIVGCTTKEANEAKAGQLSLTVCDSITGSKMHLSTAQGLEVHGLVDCGHFRIAGQAVSIK